ncbi:MAG: cell division protein FtsI [Lachnospiraceae bacterium]|nr:cell division protein FtsI [Lachnospiraceae bacterium]
MAENNANKQSRGRRKRKRPDAQSVLNLNIAGKIVVVSAVILLLFGFLVVRIARIMKDNGDQYKKQVLSQQEYDSVTIPFRRGSITDRNGVILAHSERVYNLIVDSYVLTDEEDTIEPTVMALNECFGLDAAEVRGYIRDNGSSRYHIFKKEISYDERTAYEEYVENYNKEVNEFNKTAEIKRPKINKNGIWFEDQFKRSYPNGALACDVIGFTTKDGRGQYGLEEYYDNILNGSNGREYGYLLDENALERTVVPAVNGNTLVSTMDSYIQRVCEEKIKEYNEEHADEYRVGEMGSDNTGVIVMDVNSGEVLAMASYPYFDLNDPSDLSILPDELQTYLLEKEGLKEEGSKAENEENDAEDEDGEEEEEEEAGDYWEKKKKEKEEAEQKVSQNIWKNFCISQSYEPGSVGKTFTLAMGLDSGTVHDNDVYNCGGYLTFGEGDNATTIRCHNRYGDGPLTTKEALEKSCNVALMLMGQKIGKERFLEYQKNFNFGLRTGIDLAGEMRTSSLVFNNNTMGITELMTSTFGQGYNVTMIQNAAAFCALVNGGYYYKPHMVKQILDDDGAVVKNIEPELLRQVVSEKVSDQMIDYCIGVVEEGTGKKARPAGYRIGGKTGTAERSGQGKRDYTVSFMGFAPADDPQIAVYVVIDRPNTASQGENATRYACVLCREIMTEVLPYLHIFMTEELSDEEKAELEERGQLLQPGEEGEEGEETAEPEEGNTEEDKEVVDLYIDPDSGYAIDPFNGEYLDPKTGEPINSDSGIFQNADGDTIQITVLKDDEEEEKE